MTFYPKEKIKPALTYYHEFYEEYKSILNCKNYLTYRRNFGLSTPRQYLFINKYCNRKRTIYLPFKYKTLKVKLNPSEK